MPYHYIQGTTTNGASFNDQMGVFMAIHELQTGSDQLSFDLQRPRYEWQLFGGMRTDLNVMSTLASGNRVALPSSLNHYGYWSDVSSRGALPAGLGGQPDNHQVLASVQSPVLHDVSDRFKFDLSGVGGGPGRLTKWGTTNANGETVGSAVPVSGFALATGYEFSGQEGLTASELLLDPATAGESGLASGSYGFLYNEGDVLPPNFSQYLHCINDTSVFLTPSTYLSMQPDVFIPVAGGSAECYDYFTFLCYDTVTQELVPPSERDLMWGGPPMWDIMMPSRQFTLQKADQHWVFKVDMAVCMDKNPTGSGTVPGRLGLGAPGSVTFSADLTGSPGENSFVKFVKYGRHCNLNNPYYSALGYSLTVCGDANNKFLVLDQDSFNIESYPLMFGFTTFAELTEPNTASYSELFLNIAKLDLKSPTLEDQISIDLPSANGITPDTMYADETNGNFDYQLTTKDGLDYNYHIGWKSGTFSAGSFGALAGIDVAWLPLQFGFLVAASPICTTRMPNVTATKRIS